MLIFQAKVSSAYRINIVSHALGSGVSHSVMDEYENESSYVFPESVRLLNDPLFADKLTHEIEANLQRSPSSALYKMLVSAYRRTGQLHRALRVTKAWQAFAPDDKHATYMASLLAQEPLRAELYDQADVQPAPFFTLSHFLSVEERDHFMSRALHSEDAFRLAGMRAKEKFVINRNRRDTYVLSLNKHEKKEIRSKISDVAERVFDALILPFKPIKKIEVKLTAHTEGGFFKIHQDAFAEICGSSRCISWVYYFHAKPKPYCGGDLVLFDSNCTAENHHYNVLDYTRYVPQDNEIIFFPSCFYHAVTPVDVLDSGFESSRFALAGHIRC